MYGTRATLLLTIALGGFALWHAFNYMGTFNASPPEAVRFTPPSADVDRVDPGGRRVVLAIVDGLRLDKVELLGFPGDAGARCVLEAQLPSYSRPNYVALVTGAPPWLSGVQTNDHEGPAYVESLFDVARAAGYRTAVVTDGIDWWGDLFPSAFDEEHFVSQDAFDPWFNRWTPPAGSVSLVHIVAVDDAGHDHGVRAEYDAAATAAGAQLRALWARLDPAQDTLFVTADHGHIDRGGHGGPERVVLETPLIVLGASAATTDEACHRPNTDLAATIAAALGARPPAQSAGQLATSSLNPAAVDLDAATARTMSTTFALLRRVCAEAPELCDVSKAPAPGGEAGRGEWTFYSPHLHDDAWISERPVEVGPIALASVLWLTFLGLLLFATRRRGPADAPTWPFIVRGVAYVVAYVGVVLGVEPTISFSAVWLRGPWITHMVTLTLAAAILAWALTWVLNNHLRQHPLRAAGWVLLMSALPFFAAAGVHGSLRGGPELGEPHAAFALLLGDFAILGGALSALLLITFDAIRRRRGVAV